MQYHRTPLAETYSLSELLNGRQIRTKIDDLSTHGTGKAGQISNKIIASRQGSLYLFCRFTLLCTLLWPQA